VAKKKKKKEEEGPAPLFLPPFTVMTKPVCGVCNLDCGYCYYTPKTELYPGVKRFQMTPEALEEFLRQYLQARPREAVISWQGGEPLLAGLDFFRLARDLVEKYRLPGQRVEWSIQTNGTLLDEDWCSFFAENRYLVGISIDGPPEVHDHFRKDHAGNGSFEKAWRGLELLRKHGVDFNALVTLNSNNVKLGADLYRFFVEKGVEWIQFIPILEKDESGRPLPFSCPPVEFGKFLSEVFDTWVLNDVGRVSVRIFESIVSLLVQRVPTVCVYSRRCANAYVLEWNGDLYACDHFVVPEWRLGNVLETPLVELVTSQKVEEFARLKTELPEPCGECPYLPICNGGCPKHHLPGGEGGKVNYFCEGYRLFFEHSLPSFRRIARDIAARNGIFYDDPWGEEVEDPGLEFLEPPSREGGEERTS